LSQNPVGPHTESRITRTVASTGTATHTRYATARKGVLVTAVVWWIRAWRVVVAVARSSAKWVRSTVTPAGWLVIAAVILLPVGVAVGWVELIGAGAVALVLLIVAVPFLFGGHSYEVDLSLTAERVVAGGEVSGGVIVTNVSKRIALPGRIDIPTGSGLADIHVPLLRSGHKHEDLLTIAAPHRGVITVGPVTSVRTDPLGIIKREVEWVDLHDIFVHPVTTSIPSVNAGFIKDLEGNASSIIVDSDISFHAIREYAYGDAQRHIHWKSTAKTGKLMVRQFEETRRSRLAIVLNLDITEYASDDEFEMAVSVAGSLGVRAIRDARDIAVVVSEEIPDFIRNAMNSIHSLNVLSARALLDDLSTINGTTNVTPVEQVCTLATQVIQDMSIAFVLCGSLMTPRRLQSIAAKFPSNVAVVAIICDQSAAPSYRDFSGLKVITIALLDDLGHLMARTSR